jgi:SAM-dependent methyltransferase
VDGLSKEYLISFYDRNLQMHGDRPEALRWTPKGQEARYSLMLEIAPSLEGKKILDYGCGKGDFYAFLKERGINTHYTGMDINPNLIELASSKYPECAFRVFDIEEEPLDEDFDYIFLCGVFNNNVEGAAETMKNVVSALFRHARVCLAVSAVSSYAPEKDRELNYTSPEEFTSFALGYLTPFVSLRHDCIPEDFTVFLYRNPSTFKAGQ